ncbi:MAG: ROK family protein [Fimbriiglobus sp.]
MFLGIEIGGTKLQLALGEGDGRLVQSWRAVVNPQLGATGILEQIEAGFAELTQETKITAIGVGFGGPTDDQTGRVIKSHQIDGWDDFPLTTWLEQTFQLPARICNDADTAGLGEAIHGAGQGCLPMFYITVGSGIGGGLIVDGEIYRGCGRGATEIGHLRVREGQTTESLASGWGIEARLKAALDAGQTFSFAPSGPIRTHEIAEAAKAGDSQAAAFLRLATDDLALAINHVVTLLCPRRIVIGGGVSLIGEEFFFRPLREAVASQTFAPFAGLTEILPAALGEEVVLHGAIELAKHPFSTLES